MKITETYIVESNYEIVKLHYAINGMGSIGKYYLERKTGITQISTEEAHELLKDY